MMFAKHKFLSLIIFGLFLFAFSIFNHDDVIEADRVKYSTSSNNMLKELRALNWKGKIISRRKRTEEICKKHPELLDFKIGKRFIKWETKSHLAFCGNSKAGSTTWTMLLGYVSDKYNQTISRNPLDYPKPKVDELHLENMLLFTSIRHPMTRLVSAYRNKLSSEIYGGEIKEIIFGKYRKNGTSENFAEWTKIMKDLDFDSETVPTFHEFISYVVDSIEKCLSPKIDFNCFKYTINGHWKPFFARCNPCAIKFNVTVKLETFANDFQFIREKSLELVGKEIWTALLKHDKTKNATPLTTNNDFSAKFLYQNLPYIPVDYRYKSLRDAFKFLHVSKSGGISTDQLTYKFMNLLSESLKSRLRNAYKYDFELYSYDPFRFG